MLTGAAEFVNYGKPMKGDWIACSYVGDETGTSMEKSLCCESFPMTNKLTLIFSNADQCLPNYF